MLAAVANQSQQVFHKMSSDLERHVAVPDSLPLPLHFILGPCLGTDSIEIKLHCTFCFRPMARARIVDADMQSVKVRVQPEMLECLYGRPQPKHLPLQLKRHPENFREKRPREL